MARKYFMLDPETGKHHTEPDERIFIHYPNTCNVQDTDPRVRVHFDPRSTAIELRLASSPKGWVAVCYETKGMMTFYVQLNAHRAAWQRIEWQPDFHKNWDDNKVREAICNVLWVAECEEAQALLTKAD